MFEDESGHVLELGGKEVQRGGGGEEGENGEAWRNDTSKSVLRALAERKVQAALSPPLPLDFMGIDPRKRERERPAGERGGCCKEKKKTRQGKKRTYGEMFSHLFRDGTEADRGKVIDGKPRVLGVIDREDVGISALHRRFAKPKGNLLDAQFLRHLLQEDFDKDSA